MVTFGVPSCLGWGWGVVALWVVVVSCIGTGIWLRGMNPRPITAEHWNRILGVACSVDLSEYFCGVSKSAARPFLLFVASWIGLGGAMDFKRYDSSSLLILSLGIASVAAAQQRTETISATVTKALAENLRDKHQQHQVRPVCMSLVVITYWVI
jgi:hypothetical protein